VRAFVVILALMAAACGASDIHFFDGDAPPTDQQGGYGDAADARGVDVPQAFDAPFAPDAPPAADAGDAQPPDAPPAADAGDLWAAEVAPGDVALPDAPHGDDAVGPDPDTHAPLPTAFEFLTAEARGAYAPWAEVLLLSFGHPGLSAHAYSEKTRRNDPAIAARFGSTEPPAGSVLLHVGPGCGAPAAPPVLFVHGSAADADIAWVAPPVALYRGHAARLIEAGRCVMAVTFAHPFGDNVNQAIALAAAVHQARARSGAAEVALVAHSKGGIAAVTWLSGYGAPRALAYDGGVAGLVLLGVPLGGMDWSFRHPSFNYPAELMSLSMPSSWHRMLLYGQWRDVFADSIYADAFLGVAQLTLPLVDRYPLSMLEQDWYTTYYGGQGFVSESRGIAHAEELGGYFMAGLHAHETPLELPVAIASGGNSFINGVAWETTGTADGLVFRTSAEDATVIGSEPAIRHFALLNHIDLLAYPTVTDWLTEQLP
jgi:triacylglycerol lipase